MKGLPLFSKVNEESKIDSGSHISIVLGNSVILAASNKIMVTSPTTTTTSQPNHSGRSSSWFCMIMSSTILMMTIMPTMAFVPTFTTSPWTKATITSKTTTTHDSSMIIQSSRRHRFFVPSPLRDTEKPDPIEKSFDFNVTKETAITVTVPPAAADGKKVESQTEQEDDLHGVYKIPSLDKELWFDEHTGRFYESFPNEKIPLATVFERVVDTVEDAIVHARRIPYEKGWVDSEIATDDEQQRRIPTVVVLGSGWAAHALIKVADTFKMKLIVVSPTNHFVFTPSK
jgi:hypothetical protein